MSKKLYDPTNKDDEAILLDFLENDSDLSDLSDDEVGEEEYMFENPKNAARLGADKMGPSSIEVNELHWDDEDHLPLSVFAGSSKEESCYKGIITEKDSIKWGRHDFQQPDINWNEEQLDEGSEALSPLHYFEKYINDDEFERMAYFTNIYAHQKNNRFKPTDSSEVRKLFALHIAIGCLKFPKVRLFWNKSLYINLFRDTMTRDRFFQLRSNLHCVNNLDKPENCTDKLYKVRPLYNAVKNRCNQLELEENLCVDEQIVPFRGNFSIKQYVKGKPTPWGVKIFVLCGRSGIAYDFLIYQGVSTGLNEQNLKKFGLGAAVILHLSQCITKPGHKLYFDNYFSSYQLLQVLKSQKILAAGTVRVNRFSKPPLLEDKQLKEMGRGSHDEIISEDGDVVLVKWMDNRTVVLASNFVGVGNEDSVARWDKVEKKYLNVQRPEIVKLYNHSMGGVDLLDQMISLYRIYIRSRKWTLRLIFHAVDFTIANSWFEYKKDCARLNIPKKAQLGLLDFRLQLAECLAKVGNRVQAKRGRPSSGTPEVVRKRAMKNNEEIRPLSDIQHDSVDHLPHLDGSKEGKRCKNEKCGKKTHFFCDKCHVHLCLKKERNCFVSYHRK